MKKKILALFIAIFTMLSFLCSCTSAEPQYFYRVWSYDYAENLNGVYEVDGKEPTEEMKEYISSIFDTLCEYYNVNKELPQIEVLSEIQASELWGSTEVGGCLALYDNGVIYVTQESSEGVIAHELCHYLADNNGYGGIFYAIDNIVVGRYLNEGVTNYLSTQVFQHEENYSVYEYETHVGKVLSIIFGEENLRNAFFSGDVSTLRDDFNTCLEKYYGVSSLHDYRYDVTVELKPYEVMASCIDTYEYTYQEVMYAMISGNEVDEEILLLCLAEAQSVEEMLLFYAKEKGMEKEVKEEMREFLSVTTIPFNFEQLL